MDRLGAGAEAGACGARSRSGRSAGCHRRHHLRHQARGATTGFSDVDAVLVVDDETADSPDKLRGLRATCSRHSARCSPISPMQHHGFEVGTTRLSGGGQRSARAAAPALAEANASSAANCGSVFFRAFRGWRVRDVAESVPAVQSVATPRVGGPAASCPCSSSFRRSTCRLGARRRRSGAHLKRRDANRSILVAVRRARRDPPQMAASARPGLQR